jgi:uncharacterized protein (DUF608 family)
MSSTKSETGIIRERGASNSGLNLGGIGTGGVELWPDGRLHFWNLVNSRPWASMSKSSPKGKSYHHAIDPIQPGVGHTDFFLRVQMPGKRPVYRWLFTGHGLTPAIGHFYRHQKYFFIQSCPEIEYRAEYPFIHLKYVDPKMPVQVSLRAWSAFVPRNVKDSSLPGAYLNFTVTNRARRRAEVSLVWQQQNLSGYAAQEVRQEHTKRRVAGAQLVRMAGSLSEPDHDTSGCMSIWALPDQGQKVTSVACNPYMPNLIWPIHVTGGLTGPLFPKTIQREELSDHPTAEAPNKGWLCVQDTLEPGQSAELKLGLTWFFPNHRSIKGTRVGHVYENWFSDSVDVARYMIRSRDRLLAASRRLPEELMGSTLPEKLKLSLLDQINTLTKSTHFIKNGRFGLQEGHGCCAFNTMDVDHYSSYALSTLLPELREVVLDIHTYIAHPETGKIHHGLPGTVEDLEPGGAEGYNRWDCSCQYVLQLYRDSKWSGNVELLKRSWPTAKRAIELITNLDFYDIGLPYIEGGITYDHWRMKGVVTFMAGLYLAALRAIEDMADFLGETDTADRARGLFARGLDSFEKLLWNGKQYLLYYSRRPKGAGAEGYRHEGEEGHLHAQRPPACCARGEACVEIRDTGVMTDALNGNATAAVMGLGAFLKRSRVRKQLRLTLQRNTQDENACVINGSYPDGHFLDGWPFMQWQTPWTGTEYFLAIQLYAAGLVDEGDRVVEQVYDRHVREGMRFDQTECNNHYARPLCIWGAYAARLGLDVDGWRHAVRIRPVGCEGKYEGLLMTAQATGRLRYTEAKTSTRARIEILDGALTLRKLTLGATFAAKKASVALNGKRIEASVSSRAGEATLEMPRKRALCAGDVLEVTFR